MTIIEHADLIKQIKERRRALKTKGGTCPNVRETVYNIERMSQDKGTARRKIPCLQLTEDRNS